MKQAIKTEFVEALRSGRYTQTQNCLHNEGGYCCLGVLTDLCPLIEWADSEELSPGPDDKMRFNAYYRDANGFPLETESAYLPKSVIEWAGMPSPSTIWSGSNRLRQPVTPEIEKWLREHGAPSHLFGLKSIGLDVLNDECKFDFATIADFVERFVPVEEEQ